MKTTKLKMLASRHAAALALVWLIAGLGWLRHQPTTPANLPTIQVQTCINPNTAPWYELTELPRIGPTLAWRIIQYRQTQPYPNPEQPSSDAFDSAQDLTAIRGIGPKTVERVKPFLRFEVP